MSKVNIAVVGATGIVGHNIIQQLSENKEKYGEIYALASKNSEGKNISFGEDKTIKVHSLENFDFTKVNFAIFAATSEISKKYVPEAVKKKSIIIDKSSEFRMNKNVPLIVPEVNFHKLEKQIKDSKIISSPNCCVIPLSVVLAPLNSASKISRIVLSTYQSVSGAGKEAMDELYNHTKSVYMMEDKEPKKFEKTISFNIIPKIDNFNKNGSTGEEEKIRNETRKIFDDKFDLSVTCVRVPVFVGHSLSVNIEFENDINAKEVSEILSEDESIALISRESTNNFITPKEVVGEDLVYVSRIRDDLSRKNAVNMWICSDNLRKGASTNAVQILELLMNMK